MSTVIVSNMMRCKNKQSFFALHQIQNKIHKINSNINVEFHILWDTDTSVADKNDDPYWGNLIDTKIPNLHSYTRQFFKDYVKNYYGEVDVDRFDDFFAIYFIFMAHYLRRVKLYDYYLIYDNDILINDDFSFVLDLILQQIPVLIAEPMNQACDKVLINKLVDLYGQEFIQHYTTRNPDLLGFNAGFQGIDLSIYDQFLSVDRFKDMLGLFDIRSIYKEDGTELWGQERFTLDTQQQSFFGLMNVVLSRKTPHILNPKEYFVVPNFGVHPTRGEIHTTDELDGWGFCLESKISHFIGHTQGKGKPKVFLDKVDEYLTKEGF